MSVTDRLASLTPAQRTLFEKLRERQKATDHALQPPPIRRRTGRTGEGDWPLSFDQERYWFMEQLHPGGAGLGAGLNIAAATRMRGPVRVAVVAAALDEIVRRHAAWRTAFPVAGGAPVQRVAAARRQHLAMVDLAALSGERREREALRLVGEDAACPFDLARGPLVRSSLLRLDAEDHVCLLTIHHLVTDWISFQIAWGELAALCTAIADGRRSALPAPAVHYADFALWQREWLQGEVLDGLAAWWRERLEGFPQALDLPVDRPRPRVARLRGGRVAVRASADLAEGLRAFARREGATLFMAVLAALAALLARLCRQDRLIVGANHANRDRPELENVLGCFLTQVPFPIDLGGDPAFRELLARAREASLGAFAHPLPFGQLVSAVQPERDTSRQPLIQSLVQVLDSGEKGAASLSGVSFEAVDAYDGNARYDLMLTLFDHPGDPDDPGDPSGLRGPLEFDADLFDATTAERFAELLLLQIGAAVDDPARRLSALPALSPAARHQTLVEWNDTARPLPGWTVPARFAAQASRTPDAAALVFRGAALSYGELDRRAAAFAGRLRAAGAGAGKRVVLLLERSPELVAALLGVWKAGGAAVLLDPAAPAARTSDLLADAEPAAVIRPGDVPGGTAPADPIAPLDPPHPVTPADLAYLIYTSGTTGRPKAVEVEHGSLASTLAALLGRFAFGADDRMPHLAQFSFDISLAELFLPLLAGGVCEILSRDEILEPAALLDAVERSTRLHAVPSLLGRVAAGVRERGAGGFSGGFAGLRTVLVGGDAVPPDLQEELLAAFPAAEVAVLYGPTEAAIVCTAHRLERGRRPERRLIGRPLDNVELRVVAPSAPSSAGGAPVPLGLPGELWISGPGVARGYLQRAELTAERFVSVDGHRFYRTGDLVRQVPGEGGALEFLGRTDFQVKIRGFRVEPGEVEAALLTHPAVGQAVVTAAVEESNGAERRLVAYCSPADGAAPCPHEALRAHLEARLPSYMVPAVFVALPELPRTAHGKVDRARLPAADRRPALPVDADAAPRTPAEEVVAGIWCSLLGLPRVSRSADFFTLGGHSLLATQVVSRLRAATGADLAVRDLFAAPTVAALAIAVEAALSAGSSLAAAPPLAPVPRAAEGMPLSFAQERLWFLDRLQPGNTAYNIPLALAARGDARPAALAAALGGMVRRHEVLRTTYGRRGGRAVQVIAPPSPWRLPVVDLAALPASAHTAEAARLAAQEAGRPFDLERGPVLRTTLLRLASDEHALLLNVHHIAADGWSLGVMTAEIAALYRAAAAPGQPPQASPLPPLPVQYADFAVWQRGWLQGEALERQLSYWRQRLAGAPALDLPLDLPVDRPRPAVPSSRGATLSFPLGVPVSSGLAGFARGCDATLFMVLLAAFQALLGRYTRQDDLLVGSPIANRNRTEVEPLIGFFVNTLVLRADLAGGPAFRELVAQARRTALDGYSHQDLPFERLVEELRPERRLAQNPLVQVMCAVQNAPLREAAVPGLAFVPMAFDFPAARFDLELMFWEREEGLTGQLTYSTDLFDAATMRRLAGHFTALLGAALDDPGRAVSALPLLAAAERQQLVREWNDTGVTVEPAGPDVVALLAERARSHPRALAVAAGGRHLTYGGLTALAAALARRLSALGVGPDVPVGVHAGRSPELVIGALAALWAGGAYLPLDPSYPEERLAHMVRASGMPVLLSASVAAGESPDWVAGVPVLRLEAGEPAPETETMPEPLPAPAAVPPEALAYVLYTSGSTGRPKGVQVPRGGLAALVRWHLRAWQVTAADRATLAASPGFDAAVWEIWPYLAAGASLHLPDEAARLSPERLLSWLAAERITLCFLPTPLAEQLVGAAEQRMARGELPDLALRALLTGGDRLRRAPDRPLPFALGNHYGPTESSVVATWTTVAPVSGGVAARPPSIGRPVDGTRVHVLDPRLDPVPLGVPGELWIAGAGLARGYLGRPDLTAERFLPDPFAEKPGGRMYRSGDLVRRTADGGLDFLGRVDTQVKLRGFRIELGEIESVLARHPRVAEAVAVLRPFAEAAEPRLAAYVVPRPGAETAQGEEHIAQWQELYDETYAKAPAGEESADPTFNIQGWNSSYTGAPIPAAEMREWVEGTVGRLLALPHRRVLEVGCGTGLLLFRLAPHAERYRGTDFSAVALDAVRRQIEEPGNGLGGLGGLGDLRQVELDRRLADDWSGIEPGSLDLVVLNSVVQYFPGIDYLVRVLAGAVAATAPGGAVFVGDVRSLPLLTTFHAAVELAQAPAERRVAELRSRVRRRFEDEEELVVDPAFFAALASRLPGVRAEIQLKRGRAANELTRFRYDAVLRLDGVDGAGDASAPPPLDWRAASLSLAALEDLITTGEAAVIALSGIPNARLAADTAAASRLADPAWQERTAGELRREAETVAETLGAVEPEDLWRLAERLGYSAALSWPADGGAGGTFDAVLWRGGDSGAGTETSAGLPVPDLGGSWRDYANAPLAGNLSRRLVPQLRRFLAAELPDFMVPSAIVLLDAMPLTATGKIDRAALPAPERPAGDEAAFVPPATPLETLLADVCAEVLGVERAGMRDNFFALGGHSLLATQLVSRLEQEHGVGVTLQMVFDAPDLAALAGRIEEARSGAAEAAPAPRRIPRRPPGLAPLPLSFSQERLWFLDRLAPGSTAYNIPLALRIEGDLEPERLAAALREIVRRHEALRTVFREREGKPEQVIALSGNETGDETGRRAWSLPRIDLSALPAGPRGAEARRLAQAEAERPFDLAAGPLLRAALLLLAEREHALLLAMHHIVSDGWSMGVLVREITALYGGGARLPELPIQFADFAVWQRGWLQGEALERQTAYWRQRLAGFPPDLDLPADRPRPPAPSFRGARVRFTLADEASAARLAALALRLEATPYMVLLAAFHALLARATGKTDLLTGSPIANRNRPELEPLIGFFVNTLVLRGDLAGDPSFGELVARTRGTALGAYAHQDLPFERLVEELRPERHLARNPLFQVMLAVQNAPLGRIELPGLALSPLAFENPTAQLDLHLDAVEADGVWHADLAYAADLFDAATVRRWAAHLTALTAAAVASPASRLSELPLLSAAERHQVLREWNDTAPFEPSAEHVHQLFERQAAREPEAVAVEMAGESLTYRELDRRAGRLARLLVDLGVVPDTPVGLFVDRSLALPVAVLAVLKAGGACLPLDPAYPAERLAVMAADARTPLLLVEEGMLAGLPPALRSVGAGIVLLSSSGEVVEGNALGSEGPGCEVTADHLVYVLYTSGSTGRPKGVALPHRALVNLIEWQTRTARPARGLRTLQYTTLGFDASFEEMFSTWASGGTLVLVSDETRRDPAALLAFLISERIERLFQPFVALQQLAEAAVSRNRVPASLRELVTAGEQLQVTAAVAEFFRRLPVARLFNQYGPTETHVATAFLLAGSPSEGTGWPALPPIGRPITGHRIRLLDRDLLPVPIGVPAELAIGGAGLARGYLGRPDLTAERFVPDPWPDPCLAEPGERLYRTGDLARYRPGRPDGTLEYLGRIDRQIKVRGHRVEPGEIEAVIASQPGVRGVAVVAREETGGGLRLVAYGEWDAGAESALREALQARLPEPMIPAAFVRLEALPLTPSGKVDRRALAAIVPEFAPGGPRGGGSPPATHAEREMAALWREVLGAGDGAGDRGGDIGREDNFFALGGHSLLGIQLVARLRSAFGVDLPLRRLFEHPTLAGLAAALAREASWREAPIPRRGLSEAPLSSFQELPWKFEKEHPGTSTYNLSSSHLLRGPLDADLLERCLAEVVRRHGALRTRIAERDGAAVQVVEPEVPFHLARIDLGAIPPAERPAEAARLGVLEGSTGFDLGRAPLLRAALIRLGREEHALLLSCHHIVSDGWSMAVLVGEVAALYRALGAGEPSPLPELPLQYADYALWQRERLAGPAVEAQLAWWRARLRGWRPLELPLDRPRPAVRGRLGKSVFGLLSAGRVEALREIGRGESASLFMLLLAAFELLLWRWSGQEDFLVGAPVAGRGRRETEPLIGYFVNLLPLRADLSGRPTFRQLLRRVRTAVLEAFAHPDVPFARLVEETGADREPSLPPLVQAVLNVLSFPPSPSSPSASNELPGGLRLEPLAAARLDARQDLGLQVSEAAEGLVLHAIYDAALFVPARMEELLRQYVHILDQAGRDPDARLSDLPHLEVLP
jgi:pristinamycin I synthase-3/4